MGASLPQKGQKRMPSGTSRPQPVHNRILCVGAVAMGGAVPPLLGLPQYGQKLSSEGKSLPQPMHLTFARVSTIAAEGAGPVGPFLPQ
jgi:hypothetical protein